MKKDIIYLVILVICIFNTSCTQNRYTNKDTEYKQLIDSLRCAWTLSICHKVSAGTECRYEGLDMWNKSMEVYINDSTALKKAIKSFYANDSNLIKYLKSFKKVKKRIPNFEHFSNRNFLLESDNLPLFNIIDFYHQKNNAYLDLILNYYLNTDHTNIKLLLNVHKYMLTEDLYNRIEKIFEKYGYADKEKIRVAILEDFGSLIALEGM
ncbi:MAG: hypothetical protein WCR42_08530 [bacterium]